jgi:hypothetical protein
MPKMSERTVLRRAPSAKPSAIRPSCKRHCALCIVPVVPTLAVARVGTAIDLRSTRVGHATAGERTRKSRARRAVLRILPEVVGSPSRNVVAKSEKAFVPPS